jgi:tetraacyldisaccharide 4'-kinase
MSLRGTASLWLDQQWYSAEAPSRLLTRLEILYRRAIGRRREAYRTGRKPVERLPVPVIVVGNLTVGGTGKTPLSMWLAEFLREHGYRPGIISRGYGGQPHPQPLLVRTDTSPRAAGDEPVLMARRTGCPVCVFPRRGAAGRHLLTATDCNLLIADDGLQHYALGRDIEIAVVDGQRGLGNGHCLPAGPLREPPDRLREVDWIIYTGAGPEGATIMTLVGDMAVNLRHPEQRRPLSEFAGSTVHAVAAIGNPRRFFESLRQHGLTLEARAFPDHHAYRQHDLAHTAKLPVLMTEKDAVKCLDFATPNLWYVPVEARLPHHFGQQLLNQLKNLNHGQETA